MKKLLITLGAIGLLVGLAVALASTAAAYPGYDVAGTDPIDCLGCHADGPTDPDSDAGIAFAQAHGGGTPVYDETTGELLGYENLPEGSTVGECWTCHEFQNETIHGTWTDLTEACARCHRTHSAAEDDLLIMGKDDLCKFCHGDAAGMAQTNVMGGVLRMGGSLRGGGFDQAAMNTDTHRMTPKRGPSRSTGVLR